MLENIFFSYNLVLKVRSEEEQVRNARLNWNLHSKMNANVYSLNTYALITLGIINTFSIKREYENKFLYL